MKLIGLEHFRSIQNTNNTLKILCIRLLMSVDNDIRFVVYNMQICLNYEIRSE
jgi:hypothetical protein